MPFRMWWHARGKGHCRGEPGLSGEYAPDSGAAQLDHRRARGVLNYSVRENHISGSVFPAASAGIMASAPAAAVTRGAVTLAPAVSSPLRRRG